MLELLETIEFDATLLRRCDQLRRAGFRLALDDVTQLDDTLTAALPSVDIVKVDFLVAERAQLPRFASTVKRQGKRLVAEKIETTDDFKQAKQLGFDYPFRGISSRGHKCCPCGARVRRAAR